MHKTTIMGVMFSCFLLLVTSCISAVQIREVKEEVNHQFQNNIPRFFSKSFIDNLQILIDIIIEIIIFIVDLIDNILAFIAFIILAGGHRDPHDCPLYYVTYFLHLVNLFIGGLLLAILNFISLLINDNIVICNQKNSIGNRVDVRYSC